MEDNSADEMAILLGDELVFNVTKIGKSQE